MPNSILYSIPGYGTLDARLTWSKGLSNGKRVRVSIWGKNVTDRHALQDLIAQGAFLPVPGAPIPGYTYQSLAWAAPPLWGIDLSYGL